MWWAIGATALSLALIWLVLGLARANKVVDGAFHMLDDVEATKEAAAEEAVAQGDATENAAARDAGVTQGPEENRLSP